MDSMHHRKPSIRITFKAIKAALPNPKSVFHRRRSSLEQSESLSEKAAVVTVEVLPPSSASTASSRTSTSEREPEFVRAFSPETTEDSSDDTEEEEALDDGASFQLPSPTRTPEIGATVPAFVAGQNVDKSAIASLIAEYGSSSSTSWLEFARYKIWRPTVSIPESSFVPVQGYLRADPYIFAWGNPLVSDKKALAPTAAAFWDWARSQGLKLVWCCVDDDLEAVLGKDPRFKWSALSCIVEDMLDPSAVVQLANSAANGESDVKDFKKNLRRAERENVTTREMRALDWTPEQKREVEDGIIAWKKAKSKTGLQLASTSFTPWLDSEHRRYFIAEHENKIVGILILSQVNHDQYQIKNQAMFPGAPRGTSEWLIYHSMRILADEAGDNARANVTFGITASDSLTPADNLTGWKITWMSKTYNKVVGSTGLTRRGDFRSKFHTEHLPMYVCYPAKQGFGLDAVSKLIKSLRQ